MSENPPPAPRLKFCITCTDEESGLTITSDMILNKTLMREAVCPPVLWQNGVRHAVDTIMRYVDKDFNIIEPKKGA